MERKTKISHEILKGSCDLSHRKSRGKKIENVVEDSYNMPEGANHIPQKESG